MGRVSAVTDVSKAYDRPLTPSEIFVLELRTTSWGSSPEKKSKQGILE